MRSRVKVRTCRSPTTASSSLRSVDDHSYPPIATPRQGQGESNFSDGSEALFSMYLSRASEEDHKMAGGWKGYVDGMLVVVSFTSPSFNWHLT